MQPREGRWQCGVWYLHFFVTNRRYFSRVSKVRSACTSTPPSTPSKIRSHCRISTFKTLSFAHEHAFADRIPRCQAGWPVRRGPLGRAGGTESTKGQLSTLCPADRCCLSSPLFSLFFDLCCDAPAFRRLPDPGTRRPVLVDSCSPTGRSSGPTRGSRPIPSRQKVLHLCLVWRRAFILQPEQVRLHAIHQQTLLQGHWLQERQVCALAVRRVPASCQRIMV